jgi:hypothetical protein
MFVNIVCTYIILPIFATILLGPVIGGVLGYIAFTQATKEDSKPEQLVEGEDYDYE